MDVMPNHMELVFVEYQVQQAELERLRADRAANDELTTAALSTLGRVGLELEDTKIELVETRGNLVTIKEDLTKAETDDDTGCLTKQAWKKKLQERVEQGDDPESELSEQFGVMFIDLNGVKRINDTLGHAAGDLYLRAASDFIKRRTRPTDLVAHERHIESEKTAEDAGRIGGDEFAFVFDIDGRGDRLSQLTPEERADRFAARLMEEFAEEIRTSPALQKFAEYKIGFAAGAAVRKPGEDGTSVLGRADANMYTAKRASGDERV